MTRKWKPQFGLLALAISIANPIFMAVSFLSGYKVAPDWVGNAMGMSFFGVLAGLALALVGLLAESKRTCAQLALVLGIFDLAVCGLFYSF